MGSGLIFAVIIGAWAVVGFQYLVRKHDEANESRSVDRFSHAMRILSRRQPPSAPHKRYVVMPRREMVAEVAVTGPPSPSRRTRRAPADAARQPSSKGSPAGRRGAAAVRKRKTSLPARRRRMLVVMLLLGVGLAAATVAAGVPLWLNALPAVLLVGYLVHLRIQARRAVELARTRRSSRARSESRMRRSDSAERFAARRRSRLDEPSVATGMGEAALTASGATAGGAGTSGAAEADPDGWQPVPVPLPTYVTKPKAVRPSRVIDLTEPGAWSAGRLDESEPFRPEDVASQVEVQADVRAELAADLAADDVADEVYDAELDAIIQRRRAVND